MEQPKQYLNKEERDNFLGFSGLGIYLRRRLEKWGKNLTSDERRRLKTALTNIEKAQTSIINRLPKHEAIKILRASKEHDVRVLTLEGAQALEKRAKQDYEKNLHIKLEEMETIATQILMHNCYKCKMSCYECMYHSMMSRFLIPGLNSEDNCPYSYNDKSKFTEVESPEDIDIYKQALEIHKTTVKKSNRKDKKFKNRFDDPGEDYEYNFEPKGVKKK
ncbi:hypothetical protein [Terrisporobacter petrolearius]|uniref:hypothetical protein n=1 Tax=Terrisporobacter petrolearius TaxID=1460447 RepID=UPI003AFFAED5